MTSNSGSLTCALTCWGIGALAGFFAMIGLMVVGDWTFLQAVFIAAIVFVALGALLSRLMCRPLPPVRNGVVDHGASASAMSTPAAKAPAAEAAKPAAAPAAAATAAPAAAEKPAPSDAPASAASPAGTQLSGEQELADRKGSWKYDGDSDGAASGAKPVTLMAAREGGGDDLKLLKGVGPKLEEKLNQLGFYHFDQIAEWTAEQVAWVDDQLKFKGRIERDGWIEQAKILAAGGETEFSKRNK